MNFFVRLNDGTEYPLCNTTCLTEWAWKVRESVPKLSKSKVDTHA